VVKYQIPAVRPRADRAILCLLIRKPRRLSAFANLGFSSRSVPGPAVRFKSGLQQPDRNSADKSELRRLEGRDASHSRTTLSRPARHKSPQRSLSGTRNRVPVSTPGGIRKSMVFSFNAPPPPHPPTMGRGRQRSVTVDLTRALQARTRPVDCKNPCDKASCPRPAQGQVGRPVPPSHRALHELQNLSSAP